LEIDYDRGLRRGAPNDELFAFASTLRGVDPGRSLLNLLSMRSYVGNVEIGEDAEGFEMKLNREGFVQSTAVEQLKKFTRFCIDWATILRDFHIRQEANRESYIAKLEFEELLNTKIDVDKLIDSAVNSIERKATEVSDYIPAQEREEFRQVFLKATDAIRKQNKAQVSELAHLRLIASTATLVLIFSHEVRTILGLLETNRELLHDMKPKLSINQQKEIEEIVGGFNEFQRRLTDLLELTSIVGTDHKSEKPGQIALKDKVAKVIKVFDLMIKKYSIQIDYSNIPNNIAITNILEAEVYSMLLNVLSNSIKAVIAGGKNRKIEISAMKDGINNLISIKDSGVGIDPERFEEVFIPFISDPDGRLYENLDSRLNPEDKLMIGTGSGLGLGIVREIVNAHNGEIQFIDPGKSGWKSHLEIKLP
jgi:signal transduction histidine kinase